MSVVIFEDDKWPNFYPFSSTRHVAQQLLGAGSVIEQLSRLVKGETSLSGRRYMEEVVKEETRLPFNETADGTVLAINARLNPLADLKRLSGGRTGFALLDRGDVAMAILGKKEFERASSADGTLPQRRLAAVSKGLERLETSERVLVSYPWEMLELNERALGGGAPQRGRPSIDLSPDAEVEEFVTFDPSAGPIVVAGGARLESFSRISGPCFIGPKTVVRSALVRAGTTIGENCRIGGEVDHSIVYPHSNKAHVGYLGHTIVGEWVNIGAGSETSDLKSTYGTVKVERRARRIDSGLQKLGPMVADMAKVSIGTMIYGGKTIGVSAHASGLVDRDVPDFVSYDGHDHESFKLTLSSATETLGRMMARRGASLTRSRKALIERLYNESRERRRTTRGRP